MELASTSNNGAAAPEMHIKFEAGADDKHTTYRRAKVPSAAVSDASQRATHLGRGLSSNKSAPWREMMYRCAPVECRGRRMPLALGHDVMSLNYRSATDAVISPSAMQCPAKVLPVPSRLPCTFDVQIRRPRMSKWAQCFNVVQYSCFGRHHIPCLLSPS